MSKDHSQEALISALEAEIERLRKALASSCDEQRQLYREEANWPCEAAMDNEVLRGLLADLLSCLEDQHGPEYINMIVGRVREALGEPHRD